MADNDKTPNGDELSDVLGNILSNREVMEKISGIMGNTPAEPEKAVSAEPKTPAIGDLLSNPEVMAKLPEVISVLRPMLSGGEQKAPPPRKDGKADAANRRLALLYALKPYLSPRRCEAIDYIARMSKMGDLMKNIKF